MILTYILQTFTGILGIMILTVSARAVRIRSKAISLEHPFEHGTSPLGNPAKPSDAVRHVQESNLARELREEVDETRLHGPLSFGEGSGA